MQAMNTLYAAWAGTAAPAPAPTPHLVFPSDWPSHLYMRAIDRDAQVVRMSFYLGRLRVLTPSELEVARWANEGHSDVAIAALRQTSRHTVARQVSSLIAKLGLGSRLGLARIPELNAWAPPRPTTLPANENDASDSWLTAEGFRLEAKEIARIWREIASGQWRPIASVDIGAVSYTALRRVSGKSIDWARLSSREREALDLLAYGLCDAPSIAARLLRDADGSRRPGLKRRETCTDPSRDLHFMVPLGDLASDGMSLDIAPTLSGPAAEPTDNEKVLAMLAHLLAFFCGGVIAPLVILAVKRDSKFVAFHAAQALLISLAWVGVLIGTLLGTVGIAIVRSAQQVAGAHLVPPPAEVLFMLLWSAGWMLTAVVLAVRAKGGHWSALPGFGWLARRVADTVHPR